MSLCNRFYQILNRRKTVRDADMAKTDLRRCLSTLDLTALGIGSTMGAGAYVIAGQVAKSEAGPAVVLSFFIAALASVLAGLCYSEFGARVPKAGSAYIYTYVSIGEGMAFVIGWNLILEYVIGAASIARAASGYVDGILGDSLVPWFNETAPLRIPTFAPYIDFLAVGITLVLTAILACGVKESVTLNKVFTGLNLAILSYIIVAGLFQDKVSNWALDQASVPNGTGICREGATCGTGGFMPYGFLGVIKGAATCFYAFIGFDVIATTGEEAKNPQRSIPAATIVSLTVVFIMYFGVSTTITMMAPYFQLDAKAPFARLFDQIGWTVSKYIVSVGAICALTTSLLGAMFPLPRVVLAMARDGLIFKIFANINKHLKTPTIATIFTGILAAVLAGVFDVEALVEMMSIGTLLAYTLVAASVLMLRYDVATEDIEMASSERENASKDMKSLQTTATFNRTLNNHAPKSLLKRMLNPSTKYPTPFSSKIVKILFGTLLFWIVIICALLYWIPEKIFYEKHPLILVAFFGSIIISMGTMYLISLQPQSCKVLFFKVPVVSVFPALSIAINIFLMLNLAIMTWVRFFIWMALGFCIYFGYGVGHSSEEKAYLTAGSKMDENMEAESGNIHTNPDCNNSGQSSSCITTTSQPPNFIEVKL